MSFEGTVAAPRFYTVIWVFPGSGQQKSLMLGVVQHIAVGQEGWGKTFFK